MYRSGLKRCFDIAVASAAIILLSPVLIITAFLLRLDSAGPVLFSQKRLGMNGRVFSLYKFRSMADRPRVASEQVYLDNPDVTPFGKFIRRFKIDELPQLFNVLIGDMSIVGPRPCLPELTAEFDENAQRRLLVRPGITGLAQVNGNILLSWPERWRLDRIYTEEVSFVMDCKILLKTVLVILFGEKRQT